MNKMALETEFPLLRSLMSNQIAKFFEALTDEDHPIDLYKVFLPEFEQSLLEAALKYTSNNQSRTAVLLGLSRGTLRKKMKRYGWLVCDSDE